MGLFGRRKEAERLTGKASERIVMEQIPDDDELAASLVDKLSDGQPLVINFEKLEFIKANKMLAFFAGACYALGGRTVKINEATYLFAKEESFDDGSLQEFLNGI